MAPDWLTHDEVQFADGAAVPAFVGPVNAVEDRVVVGQVGAQDLECFQLGTLARRQCGGAVVVGKQPGHGTSSEQGFAQDSARGVWRESASKSPGRVTQRGISDPAFERIHRIRRAESFGSARPCPRRLDGAQQGVQMIAARIVGQ
ncbi:MAG: hypothetical protein U5K33_06945 [Halofilum sp. (in: g-proteobacteria)]|nr:hypothetical protein [Halofilum sp. (in: g-proteobacteria)]